MFLTFWISTRWTMLGNLKSNVAGANGGEPVRVHGLWDGEAEARWVGD